MARIEKTVFISYRRKDVSWALAVYQDLTHRGYDVFFDYTNIPSGDFEQIILSNIKARAHFVLILTPTALDRCSEPGDWLRREIELAIDEKRNIVPLFFDGFNFGSTLEKLTGKLQNVSRYNGMNVHQDYFLEAMERLRNKFLNVPLNTVLHPVSTEVREIVEKEQHAANNAAKEAEEERLKIERDVRRRKQRESIRKFISLILSNSRRLGVGGLVLVALIFGGFGLNYLVKNLPVATATPVISPSATLKPVTPTKTKIPQISTPVQPTFTPTPQAGSTLTTIQDDMVMVYVPAGEFTMGDGASDAPVHSVYLDAFWIDQTEVTNKQYKACVDAGMCEPPSDVSSRTHPSYYGNPEFDNYPVIYVNWDKANRYCEVWKEGDGDLPTEAQWEKAARGTDARIYPWGNDAPDNNLLNYSNNVGDTTEVGYYPSGASIYGTLDMAGNAWEWVNDWYDAAYYQNNKSTNNPLGPETGQSRVLRGGSWLDYVGGDVRSASRGRDGQLVAMGINGFRCSRSP